MTMLRVIVLSLVCCLAQIATAQTNEDAVLIADTIEVTASGNLIAKGVVEVFYRGNTLLADEITYDRTKDTIDISGPITLSDTLGNVVSATQGTLDRDLENGILRSARLVLSQQMELQAAELSRIDGRYSDMTEVGATSCQTCDDRPPLWQIRAKSVRHDDEEKQIYFRHAQFRIYDIPVFYLPYMRLPDPTVERYQGFLTPKGLSNSIVGLGIKLPYFIPIGDDKDLTVTPFISTKTNTFEWRYRQAFRRGGLTINGSVSRDDLTPASWRGYMRAIGNFNLAHDYKFNFDLETVSDDSYLGDYEIETKDRLQSTLTLSKAAKRSYRAANFINYHSFYDDNGTLPTLVTFSEYEKRFLPRSIGGELRLNIQAHTNVRGSDADQIGRDMARLNGSLLYRRSFTDRLGIQWSAGAQARYDYFAISQDSRYPEIQSAATADTYFDARLPLLRRRTAEQVTLIEPMVQLGYSARQILDLPNEESTRVELDSANLLSLSRFPAPDRYERGLRGAIGLRFKHHFTQSHKLDFVMGQVFRENAREDFSASSGLRNAKSDFLISTRYNNGKTFGVMARAIVDQKAQVTKAEALFDVTHGKWDVNAGYSLLKADAYEERDTTVAEWKLATRYKANQNWTVSNNLRYDLVSAKTAQAGLGLKYQNECVEIDFSVSRRFTVSGTSEPLTTYGLTVDLLGFSTGGQSGLVTRSCRK